MGKISLKRKGEYLQTALKVIDENSGQMLLNDIIKETSKRLNLTEYEKERYEKTGYIRWKSILHFFSIAASKAGWLRKKKGIWYLTEEGKKILEIPSLQLAKQVNQKYREWKDRQGGEINDVREESDDNITQETKFEQASSIARQEIEEYINKLGPYEFQDLGAALLKGMGYYTPFIAPRGKDGGFDILAYKDPFGTLPPRIKIQVKHRDIKVTVKEVRELSSLLNKQGETGLMVSIGGFTSDAEIKMRGSTVHIEKIDLNDFINLWEEYYDNMKEEDKNLLPLRRIAYLALDE